MTGTLEFRMDGLATEFGLFIVRLTFVGLLYLFLTVLAILIWRDVRSRQAGGALATLKVLDGARGSLETGQRILVYDEDSAIGRSNGAAIILDDDSVSSSHALLHLPNGHWWLEDLGSTNGTRVNGETVSKVGVEPGDEIELGRVRLKLERG